MSNKLKKNMFKIVHKATNYRPKPTKPKHIKNVILSTFNVQGVNYIIDALSIRLNTKENWAVVLKALIIVQSCFEEGSKEFEEMMVTNGKAIFSLQRFKSFSPQNHPLTIYITKYARYLEEKVNILSTNGVQYEKKPDFFNDLSISDQLKGIPKLQSQFNALCNCRITNVQRASTIIIRAYILLLRDSIRLYTMLSKVIVDMCDKFSNMSKNDANQFVAVYKLFVKETNAIIKIYDGARAISAKLPQIEKIDDSIVSKLEGTLGIVGDNGNGLDDVDETPEELLPTNKNMTFSQTPTKGNDDKSESDESSSGGNEQNNDDFLIFDTPIVNNPKQFNPFTEVPITEKPNNNNDPFSLFGNTTQPQNGKNGNQKVTVQNNGGFNPFETPKTTPVQQNNPIIDLGFGTKTNIDPFSNLTSFDQPSNNNQGNPFGKVTSNNTQSQSTSNNPFLF